MSHHDTIAALADTIAALATPAEPSVRAVVRVAGPEAAAAVRTCFEPDDSDAWNAATRPTRFAGSLRVDGLGMPIESAVWLWPTERSYCGQPTAEIHTLGALPLVDALLATLAKAGVRAADRGEFTLRAVLAGRLDLLQAEAVLGVIDADDAATLSRALTQLGGGLSTPLTALRDRLLDDLADLEAGLDFVEEDIEFVDRAALRGRLAEALAQTQALRLAADERMRPPGPAKVALVGPANAGKSTLLNRLVGREAAIVSETAGTTRDWIAVADTLAGRRIEWVDTAGYLDDLLDPVDAAAARLRDRMLQDAAVVAFCAPATQPLDAAQADRVRALLPAEAAWLIVRTQADRGAIDSAGDVVIGADRPLDAFREAVAAALAHGSGESAALLATTAARCRHSLDEAAEALRAADRLAADGSGDELIALELRRGLDELGAVLGRVDHEDVLDRLFARFCIGK